MPLGFSFAPGSDLPMNGDSRSGGPSRLTPQQAVKILSLRVPEQLPGNAPVSRSLLNAPGGSAAGAGGLQSLIQQLMQAFKPSQALTQGPLPSQSMSIPPTQAPATGPSQNISQAPQFMGNGDTPNDPMLHPFTGGGTGAGGGGDFGNNWNQGVQSWANQTMQQQSLPMPHFTIGDLFGTGVGKTFNT